MTTAYADGLGEFVDRVNAAMPPDFYRRPLAEQRDLYESLAVLFPYPVPAGVVVEDLAFDTGSEQLRLRLYDPAEPVRDGLIVYLRGGGFVVGSLETHHTVAAELAARSGLRTVAIDFPMSPEHPYPAALETIFRAYTAIVDGRWDLSVPVDRADVIAVGDSSGGNMALALAMMCRDRGVAPVSALGLVSPVLDFTRWRLGGDDVPLLTGGEMEYYTACYCPDADDAAAPYVSPLVSGEFDRLPPAYIMGGGLDSLRADGDALRDRLARHGVHAVHDVVDGVVHSAIRARGHSRAVAEAWDRFCCALPRIAERAGERAGGRLR